MPDIIRLLPDNVANQIAAGEVVQRPASAVKELLENSIDAEATHIKLVVKDAGKQLIHVIDNGAGMSETDARMAFERHATSKIRSAEDIFAIITKGFRGEALASIAAVAQVELKSKQENEELGTCLKVEGSKVMEQNFCNTPKGTQVVVKNLFYNIPARRNFLKSNSVELRHIIDEFERVALSHPHIHFEMEHNGGELFQLPPAKLRQRIVNVFGKKTNEKLVPVKEQTEIVNLSGFVGKPEFAKKTRGEQFFFANNRYIKNNYLHKAVCNAFENLITPGYHPSYFLYMEIDPSRIDVNIHPTKTEVKFDDDRAIHTIIYTAVKHALGQYNIAPSLDFENDQQFTSSLPPREQVQKPGVHVNPYYNPFEKEGKSHPTKVDTPPQQHYEKPPRQDWESLMNNLPEIEEQQPKQQQISGGEMPRKTYLQVGRKYILTPHGDGMILIHQQRAHQKILYERIYNSIVNQQAASQQLLFPQNIQFSAQDFEVLKSLLPLLRELGFDMDEFGKNEFLVNGIPLYLQESSVQQTLESFVEEEKSFQKLDKESQSEKMAEIMSKVAGTKSGTKLEQEEMTNLVDELFACSSPYFSSAGKPIVVNLEMEDIDKSFN